MKGLNNDQDDGSLFPPQSGCSLIDLTHIYIYIYIYIFIYIYTYLSLKIFDKYACLYTMYDEYDGDCTLWFIERHAGTRLAAHAEESCTGLM